MRKTSQMSSRNPKKFKLIPAKFIIGTLMILFAITGCSDMPYTGSVLTVHEVDRYLVSTDGSVVCFQDDIDSTCIKLRAETGDGAETTNGSAVHIYPEKRLYLFYHEGNPIFRAERVGNNNGNNNGNGNGNNNGDGNGDNNGDNNGDGNGDNNGDNNGDGNGNNNGDNNGDGNGNNNGDNNGDGNGNNNGDNNGDGNGNNNGDNNGDNNSDNNGDNNSDPPDNSGDGHGWIIWVYYPEGATPKNAPTLTESGVTVTINGRQLTDEDITGFAQFIGSDGEKGVQFFYPTESAELLDLKIRIEGVVSDDETIKFNINYLWSSQ
ncbi:MAG: hypothetical protein OXC79_04535 [Candidatus Poribacteria bacterium]|nr:hypothetical protein [Candidatus Poribacteria bacterium]